MSVHGCFLRPGHLFTISVPVTRYCLRCVHLFPIFQSLIYSTVPVPGYYVRRSHLFAILYQYVDMSGIRAHVYSLYDRM
jgi:hypothetical protein